MTVLTEKGETDRTDDNDSSYIKEEVNSAQRGLLLPVFNVVNSAQRGLLLPVLTVVTLPKEVSLGPWIRG